MSRTLGLLGVAILIGGVPADGQQVSAPAKRDRRVITSEEIEQAQETNAYEVVQKLRPEFLRRMTQRNTIGVGGTATFSGGGPALGAGGAGAGAGGGGAPGGGPGGGGATGGGVTGQPSGNNQPDPRPEGGVFVDGTEMGGLDELKQIPASTVEEIRYISPSDVGMRYGSRFPNGVIDVKLKTR
jgi:hypothetical protein